MNRICILNDEPEGTGAGRYAYTLWRTLKQLKKPADMARFTKNETVREEAGQLTIPSKSKIPAPDRRVERMLNWYYSMPEKVPLGYALYHATNQHLARTLQASRGIRLLTILDMLELQPESNPAVQLFTRLNLSRIKEFDRVITISQYFKGEIAEKLNFPEELIDVTLLGADTKTFSPGSRTRSRKLLGLPARARIILHVGYDHPRKNIAAAIQALEKIKDKNTILVRLGHTTPKTIELIKKLGVASRVRLIPSTPEQLLVHYYRAADVFVFPSSKDYGLPILEAMASGTPVVSSNTTSMPELAGNAAILVPPTGEELAAGIERVLTNDKLSRRLEKAGKQQAAKFTWKATALATLKSYEKAGWKH